ncbi:TonB family protein [Rhizobium sp. YJ-22]|uniref:cell envelope integrity protein TolA n=1 Tax=Rhizobium sp. YJ-22 TaxID=3037556 RepID=UPI002412CE94|nr:TonB family protein [Rhizobium sp. YJ-22]MDG3576225.1 TonB family protein [Rhizobium sp. YJ-22]
MVYSRKMRADAVAVHTLPTGRGVNDNIPGLVPGHQMSDLDGVPRQPAAETVIHYARIAQIGSFPENAADAPTQPAETTMPTLDDGAEREAAAKPKRGARSIAAGLMSCLAHAAVFSLLAVTMVAVPEEPVEEAGAVVSVTMLGENEFDQLAAGDPEIVESEEVQPEELTPAEPEPVVTQPVQAAQAVAPTEAQPETPPVEPQEPMVSNEPDVLTSIVPAEPMVAQAAPVMAPAEPVEPVEAMTQTAVAPVEPQDIQPPEPEKPVEQPVIQKPEPKKPVAREKPVEKPKPKKKPTPKKAGSKGDAAEDRKRGSADGSEAANANRDGSRTAGRSATGAGSAAVANYPGKVQSKIRRSVRVPSAFRRERASMSVRVRLTIVSSGQLGGVSVARSSGVSELDEAVVNGVRRAAPFPPLPPEWGKPSWTFTQEVQVTGR